MKKTTILPLLLALLTLGCTPLISLYDADTFKDTTELKARCLVLMGHGTEPYANYAKEADGVLVSAWSLYERQKARRQNQLTFQQWRLLLEDDALPNTRALLPPFFERWKKEGSVGEAYLTEKKKNVAAAFDEILKLEGAKLKNN